MMLEIAVLKMIEELCSSQSRQRPGLIENGSQEEDFIFYDKELDKLYYEYLSDWQETNELENFENTIDECRLMIYEGEDPGEVLEEVRDYFEEYHEWNKYGRVGEAPNKPFEYSDSGIDDEDCRGEFGEES